MKAFMYRWVAVVALLSLAACNGGSSDDDASQANDEASTDVSVSGDLRPERSSPRPGGAGKEETNGNAPTEGVTPVTNPGGKLLTRSNFETPFEGQAPGWHVNYWGSPLPEYQIDREARASNVHSGSGALRFRVTRRDSGDAHLAFRFGFRSGKTYRVAMYLKSSVPTSAVVQLRRDAEPWDAFGAKTVQLTGQWQRVELQGTYEWDEGGSVRVIAKTDDVDIFVDDMSLSEVAKATARPEGLSLPAEGGQAVRYTTVASSDLEGNYVNTAAGWTVNYWGLPLPDWSVGRETRPGYVYAGKSSQRFRVDSEGGGDVHLTYGYGFAHGRTYRATLYLRADRDAKVVLQMRRDAHPWDAFATKTVTANTTWQKVEITGTYPGAVAGTLRISLKTHGVNVYLDNFKLDDVERNEMAPVSSAPVPDTLFGLHVNKLGNHFNWPALGHRIVRLWNTGTTWRALEPVNNAWDFTGSAGKRLDLYVDYVKNNDPDAAILYTLGQTPQWASTTPRVKGLYGDGASGAPAHLEDWRDYVRTLARRYAGKIRYWELWNEPDFEPHYNGSMATMVEMARIAREEIKAADPANQLVSPGVTTGQGMRWLDNFLAAGGGKHVDVVGFHWYFDTEPEKLAARIENVRRLMANHGIGDKPLWNTEGSPGCDSLLYQCKSFVPTAEQKRSVTARALMVMWAKGVSSFSYYFWERSDSLASLVKSDFQTPTEQAQAYAEAVRWMRGARMVDAYTVDEKVYVFRMSRGGESYVILWSTEPGTVVNLPGTWSFSRYKTLTASHDTIPASRQLRVGLEPVLLYP
ncbi:glycosyl hydrolase [Caldimonas brevitalea]|uniref:Asl1-like glycosyl hydrolase catalytic domain-containing protein n=1 Tax=Caldimonas brevitalea TaxID=413882 RepID=A0A0G3BV08_9BURK|nr:glycosyl hydrolase [Caldimonas brevitalea]AKJ31828.1 hypothetical protein AAW51_5137 [Caldimonas brevitalea]